MEILGKSTINPLLFYPGKIAGYVTWTALLLSFLNINILAKSIPWQLDFIAYILFTIGVAISMVSLFTLGKSTRFGIPTKKTALKTGGLYKVSRNPIYLGFDLMTISSILLLLNPIILVLGVFNIVVYHLIIIGEEQFLEKDFGEDYLEYKRKVRRYI